MVYVSANRGGGRKKFKIDVKISVSFSYTDVYITRVTVKSSIPVDTLLTIRGEYYSGTTGKWNDYGSNIYIFENESQAPSTITFNTSQQVRNFRLTSIEPSESETQNYIIS